VSGMPVTVWKRIQFKTKKAIHPRKNKWHKLPCTAELLLYN